MAIRSMYFWIPAFVKKTDFSSTDNTVVEINTKSFEGPRNWDKDEIRYPWGDLCVWWRNAEEAHPLYKL